MDLFKNHHEKRFFVFVSNDSKLCTINFANLENPHEYSLVITESENVFSDEKIFPLVECYLGKTNDENLINLYENVLVTSDEFLKHDNMSNERFQSYFPFYVSKYNNVPMHLYLTFLSTKLLIYDGDELNKFTENLYRSKINAEKIFEPFAISTFLTRLKKCENIKFDVECLLKEITIPQSHENIPMIVNFGSVKQMKSDDENDKKNEMIVFCEKYEKKFQIIDKRLDNLTVYIFVFMMCFFMRFYY